MKPWKNIKVKSGTFYVSSKEPLDGYKEVKYTDKKTKQEITVYHREFNDLQGVLKRVSIDDSKFGKQLRIFVESDDYKNVLEVPLRSPFGDITEYVRSVVQVLGNMEYDKEYRIFVNRKFKDSKDRPYKNFVFLEEDDKPITWAIHPNDFPSAVRQENKLGEVDYDRTERNDFIIEELLKQLERLNGKEETKQPSSSKKKEEPVPANTDDDDDLPF